MINVGLPSFIVFESVHISKDYCCVFGASNSNIEAFFILNKTDFADIISPNTAKYNDIDFLTLESINCTHSNIYLLSISPKLFLKPLLNKLDLLCIR
jgi:hypothetical protein